MYSIKLLLFKVLIKLLILIQDQTIKHRNELNVRSNIQELANLIKEGKGNYWTANATLRRATYL
jgi:hypothetical protein